MSKNFIIDTNVILNDPKCFFNFSENNIYIPTPVLQELDNFKDGKNVSLKSSARTAIRTIDKAISSDVNLMEGVHLSGGGVIYSLTVPNLEDDPIKKEFGDGGIDNKILKCLYKLDQEKVSETILVTEDINLRVKANALNLKAEKYKNARVEKLSFYRENREESFVSQKFINDMHQNDIKNPNTPKDVDVNENDYFVVKTGGKDGAKNKYIVQNRYGRANIARQDPKGYGHITAKNRAQKFGMNALLDDDIKLTTLVGKAGTGKTILALSCGLKKVLSEEKYNAVTIYRPTVSMGRSLGYLPGSVEEKLEPWMKPIKDNLKFIHNKQCERERSWTSLQELIDRGIINIEALSHIRGRSLNDQFVVADESQNLNTHEIKTLISRAGKGTKVVITGDPFQIDNNYLDKHSNGLTFLINKMYGDDLFCNVFLNKGERSKLAERAANKL